MSNLPVLEVINRIEVIEMAKKMQIDRKSEYWVDEDDYHYLYENVMKAVFWSRIFDRDKIA